MSSQARLYQRLDDFSGHGFFCDSDSWNPYIQPLDSSIFSEGRFFGWKNFLHNHEIGESDRGWEWDFAAFVAIEVCWKSGCRVTRWKTIGHFRLLPRNLTWNLKMMVSKRNLLFQGLLFRFRVKFQGCMKFISFWSFFFKILDGVLVLIQWCFCLTPSYSMSWNGSRSGRVFVVRLWAWSRSPWEKHHVNLAQMAAKHIIFLYV